MSQPLQADPVRAEEDAPAPSLAPTPPRPGKGRGPYPREEADPSVDLSPRDRRRLRLDEAYAAAVELQDAFDFAERIAIYNRRGIGIIRLAAANFPSLMPRLNGEFEYLELTRADHS